LNGIHLGHGHCINHIQHRNSQTVNYHPKPDKFFHYHNHSKSDKFFHYYNHPSFVHYQNNPTANHHHYNNSIQHPATSSTFFKY